MDRCIYCKAQVDLGATGDHVIPRVAGDFSGGLLFKRICVACNNKISRHEEHTFRCAPESVKRSLALPMKKNTRPGSHGSPGPQHFIRQNDHLEWVTLRQDGQGTYLSPCDHIAFTNADGQPKCIKLHERMTEQSLRRKLAEHNIRQGEPLHLHADAGTWDRWVAILGSIYPNSPMSRTSELGAGVHEAPVRTRLRFDRTSRMRTYAKIAFHYFLVNQNRSYTGAEPLFEPIRSFIMDGAGDQGRFFDDVRQVVNLPGGVLPGGGAECPCHWCHVLAMVDEMPEILVSVCLFAGPECPPVGVGVRIASYGPRWTPGGAQSAHLYQIGHPETPASRDGIVIPMPLVRSAASDPQA